jgi:acyl-CoA synthetase (AMP-forming)/AMP-acid ligase II
LELTVNAPYKFLGYVTDNNFFPSKTFHATGDIVKLTKSSLSLSGRCNNIIKVGGVKVSISELESKIAGCVPNAFLIIFPLRHETFGSLIGLGVCSNEHITRKELIELLRKRLPVKELPHKYFKIKSIPYTQTMKIDRKQLSAGAGELEEVYD